VEKIEGGEIYAVPQGLTVHCVRCPKGTVIKSGEKCFIEDDSSSIYCLKHIPQRSERRKAERKLPPVKTPRRRMWRV